MAKGYWLVPADIIDSSAVELYLTESDRAFRKFGGQLLEPISKSYEEDNEASKLDEAEEVVGVIFPADEDATLPLYPGEKALDQPASHVTA